MGVLPPAGGPKSGVFDAECCGLTCKNVLPVWAGSTFSKNEQKLEEKCAYSRRGMRKAGKCAYNSLVDGCGA